MEIFPIVICAMIMVAIVLLLTKNGMIACICIFPALGISAYLFGGDSLPDFSWIKYVIYAVIILIIVVFIFNVFSFMSEIFSDLNTPMDIGEYEYSGNNKGKHGSVIVYKRLTIDKDLKPESPLVRSKWNDMQLEANKAPDAYNEYGIYGTFSPNDRQLDLYKNGHTVLAEIELRGQKAIHQNGARGQFARITRILDAEEGVRISDGSSLRDYYKGKGHVK